MEIFVIYEDTTSIDRSFFRYTLALQFGYRYYRMVIGHCKGYKLKFNKTMKVNINSNAMKRRLATERSFKAIREWVVPENIYIVHFIFIINKLLRRGSCPVGQPWAEFIHLPHLITLLKGVTARQL